jgi:hypothetical protein
MISVAILSALVPSFILGRITARSPLKTLFGHWIDLRMSASLHSVISARTHVKDARQSSSGFVVEGAASLLAMGGLRFKAATARSMPSVSDSDIALGFTSADCCTKGAVDRQDDVL